MNCEAGESNDGNSDNCAPDFIRWIWVFPRNQPANQADVCNNQDAQPKLQVSNLFLRNVKFGHARRLLVLGWNHQISDQTVTRRLNVRVERRAASSRVRSRTRG